MTDTVKLNQSKWLNKLLAFICALGVTLSMVAPFSVVKAESLQYYTSVNGEVVNWGFYISGGHNQGWRSSNDGVTVYAYFLVDREDWSGNRSAILRLIFIADRPTTRYWCVNGSDTAGPYNVNNYSDTYNVYWEGNLANVPRYNDGTAKYNVVEGLANMSYEDMFNYVMTNGGYIPTPSFELGYIEDVKYSTQINSHGDDSVDTISWYPYFDSNNNPAVGWNAQIRVVPGYYYDSDRDSLMQQAFNLFHKEEDQAELIYDDHFVQGSFSITWGDVRNKISITSWQDLFGSFVNILDGSYWYKRGWIYQIRIYDRDNELYSDWQDVYTVTSSSGEGVENIIDPASGGGSADFYNNVENSFNTTSVVNNNYDVTYYYVNTPVDTNPSSDDSNEYLKEIRNNVIQIRQLISVDNNANNTPTDNNNPWFGDPAAELYDFEDSSINDFNDAVSDLPTSDLVTGNKFLAASTWVRTQYETLVSNTPIEAVIIFSLLLGFGLLLIGKLR